LSDLLKITQSHGDKVLLALYTVLYRRIARTMVAGIKIKIRKEATSFNKPVQIEKSTPGTNRGSVDPASNWQNLINSSLCISFKEI
jgi:hypothetical protein